MPGRRDFVCSLGVACAALAASRCGGDESPAGPLAPPRPEVVVLRLPLMAVGQTVGATLDNESLAVTRLSDTSVAAVSRTCTHQACTVLLPAPPVQTLDCPCHGSRFTTAGAVIMGPAVRPLRAFPARIEGGEVLITLS